MSGPYRSFAEKQFPHARIIADKFHVLRLLNPAINRHRKLVTGDSRKNPVRKLLLMRGDRLEPYKRRALHKWLDDNQTLKELYAFKEALHSFYRIKGTGRARRALQKITDLMALSKIPEIRTLRRTLMSWREEILNYFDGRLTNGRTEGFNNVSKLVQKRGYGYKNFENYRLRNLNVCC